MPEKICESKEQLAACSWHSVELTSFRATSSISLGAVSLLDLATTPLASRSRLRMAENVPDVSRSLSSSSFCSSRNRNLEMISIVRDSIFCAVEVATSSATALFAATDAGRRVEWGGVNASEGEAVNASKRLATADAWNFIGTIICSKEGFERVVSRGLLKMR